MRNSLHTIETIIYLSLAKEYEAAAKEQGVDLTKPEHTKANEAMFENFMVAAKQFAQIPLYATKECEEKGLVPFCMCYCKCTHEGKGTHLHFSAVDYDKVVVYSFAKNPKDLIEWEVYEPTKEVPAGAYVINDKYFM